MKKHHKLLALLAAPVLTLSFMTGCGGDDTASKSPTESKMPASDAIQEPVDVDKMKEQAEIILKTPGEAIEGEVEAAKDEVENVVDKVEDSSEDMLDAAKENADEAEDEAGDMMDKMGEKMQ